ncbi:protein argonaute 2-like [Hordeum vulgare subsp. vulgare]|uniref:protein argonaute 2-like n=1 Tax=Hordeum vulgare subsp. vulgare TaxID=112509 RepID=UPI001D1A34FC|nr:protein argonaute 2-like [Hordeum vulgare subsp. vulgare]
MEGYFMKHNGFGMARNVLRGRAGDLGGSPSRPTGGHLRPTLLGGGHGGRGGRQGRDGGRGGSQGGGRRRCEARPPPLGPDVGRRHHVGHGRCRPGAGAGAGGAGAATGEAGGAAGGGAATGEASLAARRREEAAAGAGRRDEIPPARGWNRSAASRLTRSLGRRTSNRLLRIPHASAKPQRRVRRRGPHPVLVRSGGQGEQGNDLLYSPSASVPKAHRREASLFVEPSPLVSCDSDEEFFTHTCGPAPNIGLGVPVLDVDSRLVGFSASNMQGPTKFLPRITFEKELNKIVNSKDLKHFKHLIYMAGTDMVGDVR